MHCARQQRRRPTRGESGRDTVRHCPGRARGRRRRERERASRRVDRHGRAAPAAGLHRTEIIERDDRGVVAVPEHQWLFLHPLDSIPTIRRLVAFYVQEHNQVLPHSAFRGRTPDEMYRGTGEAVPADLRVRAVAARRPRVEANRSATCERCPSLNAAPEAGCGLAVAGTDLRTPAPGSDAEKMGPRTDAPGGRQNRVRVIPMVAQSSCAAWMARTRAQASRMFVPTARRSGLVSIVALCHRRAAPIKRGAWTSCATNSSPAARFGY